MNLRDENFERPFGEKETCKLQGKTAGMKTKLERFALGLILAPLAPLAGLMVFWWSAYAILPEAWIPLVTITGLLAGILADVFLLKKLLDRRLSLLFWVAVFLFYSIGTFGFFMGVPVINAILAIPAGFVIGSRLAAENADTAASRAKLPGGRPGSPPECWH